MSDDPCTAQLKREAREKQAAFQDAYDEGFEAGMRAGEIAMKEKALQAIVEDMPCDCGFSEQPTHYKYNTESGHAMNCNQYATLEAIRALPAAPEEKKPAISGAEESKK